MCRLRGENHNSSNSILVQSINSDPVWTVIIASFLLVLWKRNMSTYQNEGLMATNVALVWSFKNKKIKMTKEIEILSGYMWCPQNLCLYLSYWKITLNGEKFFPTKRWDYGGERCVVDYLWLICFQATKKSYVIMQVLVILFLLFEILACIYIYI